MASSSTHEMGVKYEKGAQVQEGPFQCIFSMAFDLTDLDEFVVCVHVYTLGRVMTGVLCVPWAAAAKDIRNAWMHHLGRCTSAGKDRLFARREFVYKLPLGDNEVSGVAHLREILGTADGPRQKQLYRRHLVVNVGEVGHRVPCYGEVWAPKKPTSHLVLEEFAKQRVAAASVEAREELVFSDPYAFWWTVTFQYRPREKLEINCTVQQHGHSPMRGVAIVHDVWSRHLLNRMEFSVELDGGRLIHLHGEMEPPYNGGHFVEGPMFTGRSAELERYPRAATIGD